MIFVTRKTKTKKSKRPKRIWMKPWLKSRNDKSVWLNIFAELLLRWLVGLKLTQLEQQKTQLTFIILAKNLKLILCMVIKGT